MDANERRRRASEEAAEWWVRLSEGPLPRAEREAFVDWMRESALHVAELLCIARVHGALERFRHWERIAAADPTLDANVVPLAQHREAAVPRKIGRHRSRLFFSIAASLAIAAVAAWFIHALDGQTIETARGERREVTLADGSVINVDPDTRLSVRLGDTERQVRLARGRALFRVAKDPARPFLVRADGTVIRAVGTAFGVELRDGGTLVTVAEGKVAVQAQGASRLIGPTGADERETRAAARRPAASEADSAVYLTAGQQLKVQRSGTPEPVVAVDSSRALAWAEGRLIFDQRSVADVVDEFNRYNLVQLSLRDERLAARQISGVFNASDPESFIAFMQATGSVTVLREDDGDIVLASPR